MRDSSASADSALFSFPNGLLRVRFVASWLVLLGETHCAVHDENSEHGNSEETAAKAVTKFRVQSVTTRHSLQVPFRLPEMLLDFASLSP